MKKIILLLLGIILLLTVKPQNTSALFHFRPPRPTISPRPTIILPSWTPRRWNFRLTITPTSTVTPTLTFTPTPTPTSTPGVFYIVSDSTWKYSDPPVQNGWEQNNFDDSGWGYSLAPSTGCGSDGFPSYWRIDQNGALPMWTQNPMERSTAYFRKVFTLPSIDYSGLYRTNIDDDGDIYINGNHVFSNYDGIRDGIYSGDVSQYLIAGTNVIGIKAVDYGGCQYVQFELQINHPPTPTPTITPTPTTQQLRGMLALQRTTLETLKAGDSFQIEIFINTQGEPIISVDALINYDSSRLSINSAERGNFLTYFFAMPLATPDKYLISAWEENPAQAKSTNTHSRLATISVLPLIATSGVKQLYT